MGTNRDIDFHKDAMAEIEFFATCPKGFEQLLADELRRLRARRVRPLKSGVAFYGTQVDGYRVCLWSRIASHVLRVLDRVSAQDAQALYDGVHSLRWEDIVSDQATIAVRARGSNDALRNTQFIALKTKDALCDRLRELRGYRPDVAPERPDVSVWVSLHKQKATISIDYAGEPLHKRGYRQPGESVEAPLRENLAAAMLIWGGWDRLASPRVRRAQAQREGCDVVPDAPALVDPVCGSGTLVLEAAMMAADRAPGLLRDTWGFSGCADFNQEAFCELLDEADDRFEQALDSMPLLVGSDIDPRAIEIAQGNARRLGMDKAVQFVCADCAALPQTLDRVGITGKDAGFLALNPPYGVRLLREGLDDFYDQLAHGLESFSEAWRMCVITPDKTFDLAIGHDADRTIEVYNGAVEVALRSYCLGSSAHTTISIVGLDGTEREVVVASDHPEQFAARLRKTIKQRTKWASKQDIHAYRVYDADLPDYAVAIDVYEEQGTAQTYVVVTEYQAPKYIDPQKAARRFKDACVITQELFDIDKAHVFKRVRRQDKGGSQYSAHERHSETIIVEENGLPFEVDLAGYLDTGLFLDHRITRALIEQMAVGKRFLNLFAYTGTASVYAAVGGARQTTTVDMSQTYLEWARRNMKRAGFTGDNHRLVRADVLRWLKRAGNEPARYDVVFVDPPTFSNSKMMGNVTWDIQRDHVELLRSIQCLLSAGAVVVFSGNLRSFKLDFQAIEALGFQVEDITQQTIPEDFSRNSRIHFCYALRNARS